MTQKHVDISRLNENDTNKEIVLDINEHYSIVVKRHRRQVYILIRSGSKFLKLPWDIFESVCQSQVSVSFSKAMLEGLDVGLCSYCGLQFPSEVECSKHEECEHGLDSSDEALYCFHQNFLETETCSKCNPSLNGENDCI